MADTMMASYVDLRRNFQDLPFEPTMLDAQKQESIALVSRALDEGEELWTLMHLKELPEDSRQQLKEKRVLSDEMKDRLDLALFMREDERAFVYMNAEDHVLVRALCDDGDTAEAIRTAKRIAYTIGEQAAFSKDERIGWLTARPLYAGTGLQVSIVLHLPMLSMMQQVKPIMAKLDAEHLFSLKPCGGSEDKNPSAMYVLSNLFGAYDGSEKLTRAVQDLAEKLSDKEMKLRERILKRALRSTYVDQIYRAYGILKYARRLTETEFLGFWSKLRLGAAVGLLPISVEKADNLLNATQRSRLLDKADGQGDEHAIHFVRADQVRAALSDGGQ